MILSQMKSETLSRIKEDSHWQAIYLQLSLRDLLATMHLKIYILAKLFYLMLFRTTNCPQNKAIPLKFQVILQK